MSDFHSRLKRSTEKIIKDYFRTYVNESVTKLEHEEKSDQKSKVESCKWLSMEIVAIVNRNHDH
jgi:hypothetical protein